MHLTVMKNGLTHLKLVNLICKKMEKHTEFQLFFHQVIFGGTMRSYLKIMDGNYHKRKKIYMSLKEKADKEGIAVFAVPGKHPGYYFYGSFMPLVERIGGKQAILDAFNLKEGAWQSDAFIEAAKETQKMVNEGIFLEGTFGLSHTEAQTLFFQRKALFVTAGSWLEGEMADVIPEDFKLRAINQPAVSTGSGEQLAPVSTGWGGAWYVPSGAKNKDETVKFLKFLSSKEEVEKMVKIERSC